MGFVYFIAIQKDLLDQFRIDNGITHVWRIFVLDQYEHEPTIAPEVYDHIRADFKAIKDARFSVIVRFAYTTEPVSLPELYLQFFNDL